MLSNSSSISTFLMVKYELAYAFSIKKIYTEKNNGNYLKSVGTGVTWASFPTARTVGLQTATNNQTSFTFAYNVGFLDVYINGVKLTANEFTATNGTSVVLTDGAFTGDQVQLISFNTTATGGGGGGSNYNGSDDTAVPAHGLGKGGGGNGATGGALQTPGGHALAGTGSGGGGSGYKGGDPQNLPGGNGGSGFVVIAYPT